jgi:hypothetical protein|tara:strand:+ start:2535 stop:3059 length:525 start_codon:yes stop_codon:yes gene_type:complete
MYRNNFPSKRYRITIDFVKKHISENENILDLGVMNPFSKILVDNGYKVNNTGGEDLDVDRSIITRSSASVVTAFQIFEHLTNPFQVLKEIKSDKLVCSIPLRLWFSSAYRNRNDERDNHFHEFEDWQFRLLLKKTGWNIIDEKKFTNPVKKFGFRPILRLFTNRYLIVYAEKIK